jgi:hypothetical protein
MNNRIIIGFIVLFCAQLLIAQTISIGPQAGIVKSTKADKAVLMPGAAVRVNFIGISIEGSIYQKNEDMYDGSIKAKSYPVQFMGIVNMFPFINLELGVGFYNTKIEYSQDVYSGIGSETSKKIGYIAGVGSQLELGRLTFVADVRYIFVDIDFNNLSTPTTTSNFFLNVNAGIMFRF